MDGLERQRFIREQRELAAQEAKKAREELARRRAALGVDLLEQREGREHRPEIARQRQHDRLVYKSHDNSAPAAMPPADTDARIADERQFIFDVVAEVIAEERARHAAEIGALKDTVADLKRAFFNLPAGLVENTRELKDALAKVIATLADIRAERDQQRGSEPIDLPPLPSRRPN
jgi:hypothetical protein